jgi:hypothetical protein
MHKAIAIAVDQQNPLKAAMDSAVNTAKLISDFMYGTEQRARFTTLFAIGLGVAGMAMSKSSMALLNYCAV